jgi:hypothetical protein
MMTVRRQKNTIIGFIAAGLASVFGTKNAKPTPEDLKQAEFKTSTQRLGVRFIEHIRDVFRFKWLKKS